MTKEQQEELDKLRAEWHEGWADKDLEEIALRCTPPMLADKLHGAKLDHVANMLRSLIDTLGNVRPGGSFIQALSKEDFRGALRTADSTNVLFIVTYYTFIVNYVPMALRRS